MSSHSPLVARSIGLGTLETIKTAWSSPSNCIKSNWCRIPAAIIIVIGVFVLFIIFCCCAQCLSCCCCRKRRRSKRSFDDSELGPAGGQRLLADPAPFGTDLPSMPTYNMDELKKPTYAVIGDDGSVTTEDPEKRLREDFPSPTDDRFGVIHDPAPDAPPKLDMFAAANGSFHSALANQHGDTSYNPHGFPQAPGYSAPQYPAIPQNGRISPPRRQQLRQQQPLAFDQRSDYSDAPPSFTTLPRAEQDRPSRIAQQIQPNAFNTSRGLFNAGGPFPIVGTSATSGPAPTTTTTRSLPQQQVSLSNFAKPGEHTSSRPLPERPAASYNNSSRGPTLPSTDWLDDDDDQVAPYPLDASHGGRDMDEDDAGAPLYQNTFAPFHDTRRF